MGMNNKEFKELAAAKEYKRKVENDGFRSCIEEHYDLVGSYYTVIVW